MGREKEKEGWWMDVLIEGCRKKMKRKKKKKVSPSFPSFSFLFFSFQYILLLKIKSSSLKKNGVQSLSLPSTSPYNFMVNLLSKSFLSLFFIHLIPSFLILIFLFFYSKNFGYMSTRIDIVYLSGDVGCYRFDTYLHSWIYFLGSMFKSTKLLYVVIHIKGARVLAP